MRSDDDDANAPESHGERNEGGTVDASSARVPRRPYRAPSLRRLGCVRDLTLGGASGFAEGAGSFIRPMM